MDDIATPKQENTNWKQEKPKSIVNLENNRENQNRNCPRSGHYKLQKQREVYDSPKHYTPPTDKEIRKYQNENIVNQTSIIKTRPEK